MIPQLMARVECSSVIINVVTAGTYESEYAALFSTCQKAVVLRNALVDLGYEQGPTLVICDNKCASGIAADSVTQRRSKAMDMRFHLTRDRVRQEVNSPLSGDPALSTSLMYFKKPYLLKILTLLQHGYLSVNTLANMLMYVTSMYTYVMCIDCEGVLIYAVLTVSNFICLTITTLRALANLYFFNENLLSYSLVG
jgi:hypothetical protein